MILAVTGTGTGVGKTTVAASLLRGIAGSRGYKPIETGGDADGRALREASGADAGPTVVLATPVAANVAARVEGVTLDPSALVREARRREGAASVLVVETPGGLFSPLSDEGLTNADWLDLLAPDLWVLVAANRLGVLHDVEACRRARVRPFDLVVLTGAGDGPSAATNAVELARRSTVVAMKTPDDAEGLLGAARALLGRAGAGA